MTRRPWTSRLAPGLAAMFALAGVVLAPPPAEAAGDRLPDLRMAKLTDLRIVHSNGRRLLRFSSTMVNLGRGSERRAEKTGTELNIKVPDKWMSSKHARIEPSFGRWVLVDTESKNGSISYLVLKWMRQPRFPLRSTAAVVRRSDWARVEKSGAAP